MKEWIDLGGGVRLAYFSDSLGPRAGMFVEHPHGKKEGSCEGTIALRHSPHEPRRPVWTLISESPLTLSPSVHCHLCGWHHWIRNGRVQ